MNLILRCRIRAFTAIELMVSMGLFVVLLAVAAGAFVNSLRAERAILALVQVNDNASIALEEMARDIRTGFSFSRPGAGMLRFVSANRGGATVLYQVNRSTHAIERVIGSNGTPQTVTAETVQINRFVVILQYERVSDPYPARVTLELEVGSANPYLAGIFTNVQTTVSARALNKAVQPPTP